MPLNLSGLPKKPNGFPTDAFVAGPAAISEKCFVPQSGHMPWLKSASDRTEMYRSTCCQNPSSSRIFLQYEQMGKSPCRTLICSSVRFRSSERTVVNPMIVMAQSRLATATHSGPEGDRKKPPVMRTMQTPANSSAGDDCFGVDHSARNERGSK